MRDSRPVVFSIILIAAGVVGWWAAFALTLDKIAVLKNPSAVLDCNVSVLVQCGKNLGSWQGSLFGFPNPIIGLAAWVAPIVVGASLLAGAAFARWYWILFNLGVAGAMVFILWLSSQSIWVLGTLCPWCMLTWSVVIPLFWTVTARNAAEGVFGERLRRAGRAFMPWVPLATVACYLVIAGEAALAFGW
ncbi:MAG: vitamin K epoxide reductase family protein [Pseudolysinimonas sp.]